MLRAMRSRLVTCPAVTAATLLLSGCGGGGDGGGKAASPTPGASQAETVPAAAFVVMRVAGGAAGQKAEFGTAARVEARDAVHLFVDVRNAGRRAAPVRIRIPKAAAKRLEVTASVGAKEEHVIIRSADNKEISLQAIRYNCTLPPKTVCPGEVSVTDEAYELTFSIAEPGPPLGLSAVVA